MRGSGFDWAKTPEAKIAAMVAYGTSIMVVLEQRGMGGMATHGRVGGVRSGKNESSRVIFK